MALVKNTMIFFCHDYCQYILIIKYYELTEKQKASFLKHDGMMSANVYDQFYKKVREKAKELKKKYRKKPREK